MRAYLFPIIITLIVLLLGFAIIGLLKFLNRDWWRKKFIRRIAYGLVLWGVISVILWSIGYITKTVWLYNYGALATIIMLTLSMAMILALPFSGIFNWLSNRSQKNSGGEADYKLPKIDRTRRLLLKTVAITFPTISASKAVAGMASAFACSSIYIKPMKFANLPDDLHGFRILHLSDSHLGIYKSVEDIKEVLLRADQFKPNLTVFTGDIADELSILPDTLSAVFEHRPEYGAYASLGNHEYYRGIKEVIKAFDSGPIPLLKNSGLNIRVGETDLFLGGIDDPRVMGRDASSFYKKSVETTFREAPENSFKIMLSHRPDAFNAAADINLDLTLSGHTHGGQVGFNNRSVFNRLYPESYLWGDYIQGRSQMYVSCGIGHWFPFRLGCPSEAPIIELQKG
ncbi:MAG: metallophosphoesterase [Candidatus Zixiibacteriota bacterium]